MIVRDGGVKSVADNPDEGVQPPAALFARDLRPFQGSGASKLFSGFGTSFAV